MENLQASVLKDNTNVYPAILIFSVDKCEWKTHKLLQIQPQNNGTE